MNQRAGFAILLFVALLLIVSSVSAKVIAMGSAGECPSGKVRDWAGICYNKSEAKACLTCASGSAAEKAVEKPSETSTKVEKQDSSSSEKSTTAANGSCSPELFKAKPVQLYSV